MKTVKTCELIGPALDWALAQIDGIEEIQGLAETGLSFSPSTNWAQGGLLIDEYSVTLVRNSWPGVTDPVTADCLSGFGDNRMTGKTRLEAACRSIAAAKLGQTVQIPGELWTAQNDTAPTSRTDSENARTPH